MTDIATIDRTGAPARPAPSGFASLDQGDFLKLMLAQLEQQDPFEPVDNQQMLAQMAQFSTLAGSAETNETLKAILARLDAIDPNQRQGD